MRTMWSCSSICCGFLQVISAPFTSACSSERFSFPWIFHLHTGRHFRAKTMGPHSLFQAHCIFTVPLGSELYSRRISKGIFIQVPRSPTLATWKQQIWASLRLRVQTISGLNMVKLRHETWLFFFPSFFFDFPHMRRPLLFETILHFNFFLELMYCFNVFQSAPLHLNHPCVCSQAGGQK